MPPALDLLEQARQAHQAGHFRQAELLCLQLLQDEPECTEAWRLCGSASRNLGKPSDAAASYHQLLRLQPNSAEAHYLLGSVCAEQGQRDQALEHYRHA